MRGAVLALGYILIVPSVAIADRGISPDEAASLLFEEQSEWLLAFCTRQLRDRADAEDAVQATFLYALRALRRGVVPECERAWLTTIAKNVCHTHRRTSRRRTESVVEPELDRIALAQPDLEEVGFVDAVRAALSSLPANQRRALLRREWQGVPSSEIADELHLSRPATDALLFRARRSFTTAMSASGRLFGGLNVLVLLDQLRGWLRPLLGGVAVKAAVATTAASVVVGGVVIEQRSDGDVPLPRPVGSAASVGVASEPSPAPSLLVATPVVSKGQVASPAPAPATRLTRESESPGAAHAHMTVTRLARPPKGAAEASTTPASPPPRTEAPIPAPAPPADSPVPAPPVDLPPILGEDPPVQLPPPVEDLLPPVAVPPLPLPSLPPPLPLPSLPPPLPLPSLPPPLPRLP